MAAAVKPDINHPVVVICSLQSRIAIFPGHTRGTPSFYQHDISTQMLFHGLPAV
ncbi:hypothetical protein [Enterobacter cloacae complex sp. ESBL7]|uniref:hypothetical protein n=1 Tax=Enterobacter cloacae complex sp. ESBL7 TaxID=3163325 RepID=UPI0035614DD9